MPIGWVSDVSKRTKEEAETDRGGLTSMVALAVVLVVAMMCATLRS